MLLLLLLLMTLLLLLPLLTLFDSLLASNDLVSVVAMDVVLLIGGSLESP